MGECSNRGWQQCVTLRNYKWPLSSRPFNNNKSKPVIYTNVVKNTHRHHKLEGYNLFYQTISCLLITITIFLVADLCLINLVQGLEPEPPITMPADPDSDEVSPCEACRLVVKSFEKGVEETARGKHEGGDTSWEERKLKSYADSEVRLVEIQEMLCADVKKGKAQCLSLAEDTEAEVEHWWFNQRKKNVRLHDYLCISKLKRCCPEGTYGSNCQSCPSDCNKHGQCDGSGTRTGTGSCHCDKGYEGNHCDRCSRDHFRIATSDHFTCRACDPACERCYGPGKTNCTECRSGYYKHDTDGCVDINECDIGMDSRGDTRLCEGNTYCINTDGSYRCADCHMACSGCIGYGPSMCMVCAEGYKFDSDYSCVNEEELEKIEHWDRGEGQGKGTVARYFFYIGVLAVSVMMFRSNLVVMYTFTLGFIIFLLLSELDLLDDIHEYTKTSSE